MKFWEVFRYEFAYQVRQPWPWLFFAALIVLDFLMTRDGSLSEVLYSEFFLNSPFAIAKNTVFGSLIWLLMAGAIAGDAGARDVATGMHPLVYTTTLRKGHYLGGRFLAALTLNALLLLAVQLGIVLGVYLPGVDAPLIGPFRPAGFLTAYAFISLPNAFAATAIQFALAAKSGRPMAAYFGSFLIVFMGFFVASLLLFNYGIGRLVDPVGIRFVVEDMAHLWTTTEKNWRLMELEGTMLMNRLLWVGIALAALCISYLSFRFTHRTGNTPLLWKRIRYPFSGLRGGAGNKHETVISGSEAKDYNPVFIPQLRSGVAPKPKARQYFGFSTHIRQVLAITGTSFWMIATSWAGLAFLVAIPLMTVPVVLDQMVSNGVPLVPVTIQVLRELTAPLSAELSRWVIIPFLLVFFAGELVWREREAGLGEMTDAMPGSDWVPFLGKFLGIGLVLSLFLALLAVAGMLGQVVMGYQNFEVLLYLKVLFGLQLPEYLIFAMFALVVHVLVDQKYIGHLVGVIVYVFIAIAPMFGVEHNLLIYGAGPGWSYTEMQGFGPSIGPWLWFKLYWAMWALTLAVLARLLWVRGRKSGYKRRLQEARHRFSGPTAWTALVAVGGVFLLGGFIFYNTNVRNEYLTAAELDERKAAYEQRYGQYKDIPQPRPGRAKLQIEIYPEDRAAQIHGTYQLVNRSEVAIDTIHLTVSEAATAAIKFEPAARLLLEDNELGYRMYAWKRRSSPAIRSSLHFRWLLNPMDLPKVESMPLWWRMALILRIAGSLLLVISRGGNY